VLLFSSGKIQHIVSIFDQDSAFRFRLGDIYGIREDSHFSSCNFLYIACRKSIGLGD